MTSIHKRPLSDNGPGRQEVNLDEERYSDRMIPRGKVIVALAIAAWGLVFLIIWAITLML